MNAISKFVVLPLVAVVLLALAIGAAAVTPCGDKCGDMNATAFVDRDDPNPASDLSIQLTSNTNVLGVMSGRPDNVAVIVKQKPEGDELADICTKAGALGFTTVFTIVSGSAGHNLGDNVCP